MNKKIWCLTLFPSYFDAFKEFGVVGKLLRRERKANGTDEIEFHVVSLSDYSDKGFKGVDDAPYGGGPGMVLRADVLKRALLEGVVEKGNYGVDFKQKLKVIFTGPRGKKWVQQGAQNMCQDFFSTNGIYANQDLVFIAGRYEGIDERFIQNYVDLEISVGDYVLSGGEIAIMAILDSILRLVAGTLSNPDTLTHESFNGEGLDHPLYTRPANFEGLEVPSTYLSGNHAEILAARFLQRRQTTKKFRPDLLDLIENKYNE